MIELRFLGFLRSDQVTDFARKIVAAENRLFAVPRLFLGKMGENGGSLAIMSLMW